MKEGNAASPGAEPRRLVDQLVTGLATACECGIEVGNAIAHVMDAGPATLQEAGNRAVGGPGCQEFNARVTEREAQDISSVGLLHRMRLQAKHVAVERGGRIEVGHGNPDVGNTRRSTHGVSLRMVVEPGTSRGSIHFRNRPGTASIRLENNRMSATNTQIQHVTDDTFSADVEQASGLVLVDFWATWCGPCQAIAPILEQLAGEHAGKLRVAKVDVDANQSVTQRFNVRSIPSILFFRDGRHVDTVVGAVPKATLQERISKHLG